MPETVFPERMFSPVDIDIVGQYQDEVSLFLSLEMGMVVCLSICLFYSTYMYVDCFPGLPRCILETTQMV